MTTLIEFLTARIDEDEAVARDTLEYALVPWDEARQILYRNGWHSERAEAQINRWNPARVLAEVASKRRIMAEYTEADAYYRVHVDAPAGELAGLRTAIRLLAQPHSDHPDFDPDWRTS